MTTEKVKYGVHSEAGKLRKVMVCSPGLAHQRLTPNNCDELLFDDVLWVAQAKRDHFDFVTKMRERGIEVVEMHNLLEETVSAPNALKWILDRKITPNSVGLGLQNEVRAFIEGLEPRKIAEFLILYRQMPRSLDAVAASAHLLGILLGIRVLARTRPDRTLLESIARPALDLLDLPVKPRGRP